MGQEEIPLEGLAAFDDETEHQEEKAEEEMACEEIDQVRNQVVEHLEEKGKIEDYLVALTCLKLKYESELEKVVFVLLGGGGGGLKACGKWGGGGGGT